MQIANREFNRSLIHQGFRAWTAMQELIVRHDKRRLQDSFFSSHQKMENIDFDDSINFEG